MQATIELIPRPARRRKTRLAALIAASDYTFAGFILAISADAFVFLGLHSLFWAAAYVWFVLRLALSWRAFLAFTARNLPLLAYAGLSLVSVLWSDTLSVSLRFTLYLGMSTLFALFIAMRLTIREIFWITGIVLLATLAASFANLGSAIHPAYHPITGNFVGIYQSKNTFGSRAIEFVILATFAAILLPRIPLAVRTAFLAGLLATAYMATLAGSATAIVLTLAMGTAAALLYLAITVRSGPLLIVLPTSIALALGIIAIVLFRLDPITPVLAWLGKDATLTGRTMLWDFGLMAYQHRPLLGFGAGGFWDHPAFAADIAIIQRLHGETVRGFHNLPIELLVTLGPLGLLAHGTLGGTALARAARLIVRRRDRMAIWVMAATATLYAQATVAPSLYIPHNLPLILLIAIAAALGKELDRGAGSGSRFIGGLQSNPAPAPPFPRQGRRAAPGGTPRCASPSAGRVAAVELGGRGSERSARRKAAERPSFNCGLRVQAT